MKRICGIALLALLTCCSLPLLAARNSHGFLLETDVRIGDVRIPHGQYSVSWTDPSGSQVQLTLKGEGKTSITVPARVVAEPHSDPGVDTFEQNGVTYLQDLHTTTQTFILSEMPGAPK
jgi:hypothetical protein